MISLIVFLVCLDTVYLVKVVVLFAIECLSLGPGGKLGFPPKYSCCNNPYKRFLSSKELVLIFCPFLVNFIHNLVTYVISVVFY